MKISWGKKQILIVSVTLLFISFLYYLLFRWSFSIHGLIQLIIALAICAVLLTLFNKYSWRLSDFLAGEQGESRVGSMLLNDLPEGYSHLPNINLERRGNIDHLIVGPTGIWTIEVKSHVGNITFDGTQLKRSGRLFEKDFLGQAWAQAYSVKNLLKEKLGLDFSVQPVIAFSSSRAKMRFGFNKIRGVYIINSSWLTKLVLGGKHVLETEGAKEIVDVIKQFNVED